MIIQFRQGIISAQTNNAFLELVSGKVNINVDIERVDVAFAYTTHDYLFTEAEQVIGAWGPFPANQTAYLYWDIDMVSGVRTFGTTTIIPKFGTTLPTNPAVNQHYFDYNDKKMKVWSGVQWVEKLRVFAGSVQNNAILTPNSLGSQVGLNGQVAIGYILFNSLNAPLRVTDSGGRFYFLTTEDQVHTQQDIHNAYKIDSLLMDGKALEPIPTYHCVTWKGPKQLGVASYVDYTRPCIGISVEPFGLNEVKKFVTKGFLTNYNFWNWTQAPNTALFVGDTGEITTDVPQKWSIQKIGHIVSPDTIFVDIEEQILIESNITAPSPTPSVTPTGTPSSSLTRTPTPTPSISRSTTPSPTPSVTHSPVLSQTPVVSQTPTRTPTPTPTTSAGTTNVEDYVSLFYQNTAIGSPSVLTLSTFNGVARTDFGAVNPSWFTDGNGTESIGDKFTRKIMNVNNVAGSFVAANIPNVQTPQATSPPELLYESGQLTFDGEGNDLAWVLNDTETDDIRTQLIQQNTSSEITLPVTAYVIDQQSGYAYGMLRYMDQSVVNKLMFFWEGLQYTTSYTLPTNLDHLGASGMGLISTTSTGNVAFIIGFSQDENPVLNLLTIEPQNVDPSGQNVDFTFTAIPNSGTNAIFIPDTSNMANFAPEIYEVKQSDTNGCYYISMVNTVQANRQSMNSETDNATTRIPFVLVYDPNANVLNTAYDGYAYSYITISDNYGFTITPDFSNTPYGAILNVYQYDSTGGVSNVTSLNLTDPDGNNFPPVDARIRSVETQTDLITIYTFGFGIYTFTKSTQTLSRTGISDIYGDMALWVPNGEVFTNKVIDTWAGKLFPIFPS